MLLTWRGEPSSLRASLFNKEKNQERLTTSPSQVSTRLLGLQRRLCCRELTKVLPWSSTFTRQNWRFGRKDLRHGGSISSISGLAFGKAESCHMCVWPWSWQSRGFTMATMPFGAISSVYSFLRTAAAINNVGCSLLGLPMSSYFDDFTVVTRSELSKSANLAVTTLFDVLGFEPQYFRT